MVWAFYPESNQRTLEEMNLLFAADSVWNWEAERNFALLKEQNPDLVQAAQRGHSVIDPETGLPRQPSVSRGMSLDASALTPHARHNDGVVDEKQTFKHSG